MTLSSRFNEAFCYAAGLHAQQRRKLSGEPYLAHLMAVAAMVMEHGGNEDEAIAALLHDAVEDQGGLPTLDEIRRRFGPAVAEIVEGCTDTADSPKPPWRQRKEAYIARLRGASASIRLVSAADKLHNARAIFREYGHRGESLWEPFSRRPRRDAVVLSDGGGNAEGGRGRFTAGRQFAGRGTRSDRHGNRAVGPIFILKLPRHVLSSSPR